MTVAASVPRLRDKLSYLHAPAIAAISQAVGLVQLVL